MSERGQACPEYIAPCGKSHGAQTTGVKDSSHQKTKFGFHPCNRYRKWCVQDSVQESGSCLSNVYTGFRDPPRAHVGLTWFPLVSLRPSCLDECLSRLT